MPIGATADSDMDASDGDYEQVRDSDLDQNITIQ